MRTAKQLLITVAVLLCSAVASAHDFEVGGIYYDIISSSDLTVEVTHKGNDYSSYDDEYSGAVVIPQTVTYNSKTYSVTTIGEYTFYNCTGLTSVTIPNSVTTIGYEAFYNCTGLTSVTIGNSVTTIGVSAFSGCTGLTSITIPNSVTRIGEYAFYNTAWYNNQPDGLVYAGKVLYKYKGTMPQNTSIVIEDGTLGIGGYAFNNCTGLTSVTIPNSVTTIGDHAFGECTGLTSVTIPNSVTTIGHGAFWGCGLTSVTIPNSVTTIGDQAFHYTAWYNNQPDGLVYAGKVLYKYKGTMPQNTSIVIKDGTLGIAGSAFNNCTGLTSVTIPNSVTTIGSYAFEYCTGLTSVTIPNSVTTIEYNTFYYCTGLTSVTIPNSVTTIGIWAFWGCDGLTSIYLLGKTPPAVGSSNFKEKQYTNTILYVPAGTLETYRNADTWKNFLNIQEVAAPGTPEVGTKKCATPVISYNNCGLDITCNTDEAEIHTTIKCSDANSYNSGRIDLSATYEITTYATLAGYEDSEIATATLCWVEKESDSTDIIEVIGNPVLICTNNGSIVVKGAEAGTEIAVYNINGTMQGTATANGSEVVINTSLGKGDIVIINIGGKAIKVVMQ